VFEKTEGEHGFVSLEVLPCLAAKSKETVIEAKRLFEKVARPNLMIKVPATAEGIVAFEELIAAGINVNVTLIFGLDRYSQVMDAFLTGLEQALANGHDLASMGSVASFFVSR
jgi:transaldolase